MQNYVATFYTHLSALRSSRALSAHEGAEEVRLSPVPRTLSSSCGTCMRYRAPDTLVELMDADLESIAVALPNEKYEIVYKAPQPE